jgi:hypothetical protein
MLETMAPRLTTERFIERARSIHGDLYLYDRCVYLGDKKKVEIGCMVHGYFLQQAGNHIYQCSGCQKCYGNQRSTAKAFAVKARSVHGDRYIYDRVDYVNNGSKVEIGCRVEGHGYFWQTPSHHTTNARGCPRCKGGVPITLDDFLNNAREVHGDLYLYDRSVYINSDTKIEIGCRVEGHGYFWQVSGTHGYM